MVYYRYNSLFHSAYFYKIASPPEKEVSPEGKSSFSGILPVSGT
jgi:hypothetical protein